MPESTLNPVISLLTDFGVVDPYVQGNACEKLAAARGAPVRVLPPGP